MRLAHPVQGMPCEGEGRERTHRPYPIHTSARPHSCTQHAINAYLRAFIARLARSPLLRLHRCPIETAPTRYLHPCKGKPRSKATETTLAVKFAKCTNCPFMTYFQPISMRFRRCFASVIHRVFYLCFPLSLRVLTYVAHPRTLRSYSPKNPHMSEG